MWILSTPLALIGLASVPVLVGIYFLRSRARRRPVSSLLLWVDQQQARQGGRRVQRIQTPLLFLLEILILTLLVMAAADPRVRRSDTAWPTVIVLDDSYSMSAGGDDSPRRAAIERLESFIARDSGYPLSVIIAGRKPRVLVQAAYTSEEAVSALGRWECGSASTDLREAVSLASTIGGPDAKILVVTDHPAEAFFAATDVELPLDEEATPTEEDADSSSDEESAATPEGLAGRLRWWAFGEPRENIAITSASRTSTEGDGRVFVEIANLSDAPAVVPICVTSVGDLGTSTSESRMLEDTMRTIQPRETLRLVWQVPDSVGLVRVEAGDDQLMIDNRVELPPSPMPLVRVKNAISDPVLREAVQNALDATQQTIPADSRPEVLFCDAAPAADSLDADAWVVRFLRAANDETPAYTGPFIVDRSHPLTDGLSLGGVIWASNMDAAAGGRPLVSVGDIPLVTEIERPGGFREFRIGLVSKRSTLTKSPGWPVLIANIVRLRDLDKPGLAENHVRLGTDVRYHTTGADDQAVSIRGPDDQEHTVAVRRGIATFQPTRIGRYMLQTVAGDKLPFTVSTMNRAESDLADCRLADEGTWLDERTVQEQYRSIAWLLLLPALALLTLHRVLLARKNESRNNDPSLRV